MYVQRVRQGYDPDGAQRCSRGAFLILISRGDERMRGVVRKVALSQFGQWMMGRARVYGHTMVISGAYGGDGLPVHLEHERLPQDVQDRLWEEGEEVPPALYDAWANGGGWNSAGSEAEEMLAWGKYLAKKRYGRP
jgi:hypothetical protein